MPAKKDTASSRAVGQGGKGGRTVMSSRRPYPGKPIELLNKREFRNRFCLPNGVSIQLMEGDPMFTQKVGHNAIFFSKKQFNVGLCFPIPSLFKKFLHYT